MSAEDHAVALDASGHYGSAEYLRDQRNRITALENAVDALIREYEERDYPHGGVAYMMGKHLLTNRFP
jgi:hypothetical protein